MIRTLARPTVVPPAPFAIVLGLLVQVLPQARASLNAT
jgi:hypothetical protein